MKSMWIIVALVANLWTSVINGENYNKVKIGTLKTNAHGVTGEVYALSEEKLYITGFNYDGTGPDAFFYIGTVGSAPSDENGIKIADEKGTTAILGRYQNADIVLTLPNSIKVSDIKWISVWCRKFRVDFGSLVFPASISNIPAPVDVGNFIPKGHGTSSGLVTLLDSRTVLIRALKYDGQGPDAFFWVGTSTSPDASGNKIPDEKGSLAIAKGYDGSKDITLTLPPDMSFNNLRWLSLYCITYTENFGHVLIPENMNLPTYVEDPMVNCHQLHKKLNVAWKIIDDEIEFTLTGALETDGYMSFGLSGSESRSAMIGGDVAVVYNDASNMPVVVDYTLQSYALCSGSSGVCPDEAAGGSNSITLVSGSTSEGITTVTYKRKLITGETTNDINIPASGEVYVIWAMGKLNSQGKVTKHDLRLQGNLKLEFGRSPSDNCMNVEVETDDGTAVKPWNQMYLSGENDKVFMARMGPTGGKKGYFGITGENSWGIAWYIEGMLIPYVVVRRGETYTFIVEGGDDKSNTAEYHPFYITDSNVGGYDAKTDAEKSGETIYAGPTTGRFCEYKVSSSTKSPESYDDFDDYFNTLEPYCVESGTPGNLTWTPNSQTPDMLYYQCSTHQYLGWKIRVVNDYSEFDFMNGSNTIHISSLSFIACLFGIVLSAF